MSFVPPIKKEDIKLLSDSQILDFDPQILLLPTVSDSPERNDWDDEFKARTVKITKFQDLFTKLKSPNFASDRSNDTAISDQFNNFVSDIERLIVWDVVTFIPGVTAKNAEEKVVPQAPRLRQIFILLGEEYKATHKRVIAGKALGPNNVRQLGSQKAR